MPSLSAHESNDLVRQRLEREFKKDIVVNESGCWLWQGYLDKYGYARYGTTLIHCYSFRIAGFECPPETEVCHKCPNKNCVTPWHAYAGTHKQNMEDNDRNGKTGREGRDTIIYLHCMGMAQVEIAKIIQVTRQAVWYIIHRYGENNAKSV